MSNTQAPIYNAACCPSVRWSVRPSVVYSKSVSTAPLHSLTQWCYCSFRLWRYVNTTFLFVYGRLRCAWDVGMQQQQHQPDQQFKYSPCHKNKSFSVVKWHTYTDTATNAFVERESKSGDRQTHERRRRRIYSRTCVQRSWSDERTNVRMNEWNLVTSVKPTFLLIC